MTDHPNLAKLNAFVDGHIAIAAKKTPAEAREHLEQWASVLNDRMLMLGQPNAPAALEGLTAFDLSNARDRLVSAAPKEIAA